MLNSKQLTGKETIPNQEYTISDNAGKVIYLILRVEKRNGMWGAYAIDDDSTEPVLPFNMYVNDLFEQLKVYHSKQL